MTNYREILRLNNLRINNTQIAASCNCTRPTVIQALQRAKDAGLEYTQATHLSDSELKQKLYQKSASRKVLGAFAHMSVPLLPYPLQFTPQSCSAPVCSRFRFRGQRFASSFPPPALPGFYGTMGWSDSL